MVHEIDKFPVDQLGGVAKTGLKFLGDTKLRVVAPSTKLTIEPGVNVARVEAKGDLLMGYFNENQNLVTIYEFDSERDLVTGAGYFLRILGEYSEKISGGTELVLAPKKGEPLEIVIRGNSFWWQVILYLNEVFPGTVEWRLPSQILEEKD